ncbi:MAG: hypothetical protein COA43_14520 [Robiginitomaculum sp.]|nr:MAG: hypothetical protein COA43_14520 [Robiginitomaculum sp.]
MKSILDLEQVANILSAIGYSVVIDSDEYGASALIKYNEKLLHVIDYRDLNGCHTSVDIENLAIKAVDKHENPNLSNEVLVEDLSKDFD